MSLQADYRKERAGIDTIEFEDGFISYSLHGTECFVEDLYVRPGSRKSSVASGLAASGIEVYEEL